MCLRPQCHGSPRWHLASRFPPSRAQGATTGQPGILTSPPVPGRTPRRREPLSTAAGEAGRAGDFSTGFLLCRRGRAGRRPAVWGRQKKKKAGWAILRFGETSAPRSAPAQVSSPTCSSRANTQDYLQSGGISKLLPRVLRLGRSVGGREGRVVLSRELLQLLCSSCCPRVNDKILSVFG